MDYRSTIETLVKISIHANFAVNHPAELCQSEIRRSRTSEITGSISSSRLVGQSFHQEGSFNFDDWTFGKLAWNRTNDQTRGKYASRSIWIDFRCLSFRICDKIKILTSRIEKFSLDSNCHVILEKVTDFCAIITGSCRIVATIRYTR